MTVRKQHDHSGREPENWRENIPDELVELFDEWESEIEDRENE